MNADRGMNISSSDKLLKFIVHPQEINKNKRVRRIQANIEKHYDKNESNTIPIPFLEKFH